MHPEVVEFLTSENVQAVGWKGTSVLEVGAQDVNGRARDCFEGWATWDGIDLVPGPGVTFVGDACMILPDLAGSNYDRTVSTEVLEHTADWWHIVHGMVKATALGGYIIITCASPAREPHGANGGPLSEGEYYQGVSLDAVVRELRFFGCSVLVGQHFIIPGDVRVLAKRDA